MRPFDLTVEEVRVALGESGYVSIHSMSYFETAGIEKMRDRLNTFIETKRQAFAGAQPRRERERGNDPMGPST